MRAMRPRRPRGKISPSMRQCSVGLSDRHPSQFCWMFLRNLAEFRIRHARNLAGRTMTETNSHPGDRRLVIGISGASGVYYGIRLLQLLRSTDIETHLVMSRAAQVTLAHETDLKLS